MRHDGAMAQISLRRLLLRGTATAAAVLAASMLAEVLLPFTTVSLEAALIVTAVTDVVGWVALVATAVTLLGLALGWILDRPETLPGTWPAAAGILLQGSWTLVNGSMDLWGIGASQGEDDLRQRVTALLIGLVVVQAVSIVLLVIAAVRMVGDSGKSGQSAERCGQRSQEHHDDVGGPPPQGESRRREGQQPRVEAQRLA